MTGNSWRQFSVDGRRLYLVGVLEGWTTVFVSGEGIPGPELSQIMECIIVPGRQYGQEVAIVEKFMADNPRRWHQPMSFIMWEALLDACPKKK
jgi:hypothetical protein